MIRRVNNRYLRFDPVFHPCNVRANSFGVSPVAPVHVFDAQDCETVRVMFQNRRGKIDGRKR